MDEKKDNQDLTVGVDGAMIESLPSTQPPSESEATEAPAVTIEVTEPSVNSIAPPPTDDTTQPPSESEATEAPAVTIEVTEPSVNSIAPPPTDETIKPPDVAVVPVHDPSSGVVQAPDDDSSSQTIDTPPQQPDIASKPDSPQEFSQTSRNTVSQQHPHEHRNNKKLAVFITIFIALLLSGAAIFVYVSTQDNAALQQPVNDTTISPAESQSTADQATEPLVIDEPIEEPIVDPSADPAGLSAEPDTEPLVTEENPPQDPPAAPEPEPTTTP
jgi:hypothetical protein